jgi:hypothetical protein
MHSSIDRVHLFMNVIGLWRSLLVGSLLLFLQQSAFCAALNGIEGQFDLCLHCPTIVETSPAPMVAEMSAAAMPAVSKATVMLDVFPGYQRVKHHVREVAGELDVDHALFQALIATESKFNASAVGPGGAVGLMQIMPSTAVHFGLVGDKSGSIRNKLIDPRTNLQAGGRYLRYLMNLFPGRLELVVAAYNAGEGTVKRAGNKIPNNKSTPGYVKTVMRLYALLKSPVLAADEADALMDDRVQAQTGPADPVNY